MKRFSTVIGCSAILASALMLAAPANAPVADSAMKGDKETLRALLQRGTDVNAAHNDGMSALHWAAERGDLEMAEMLLAAGASPKSLTRIGAYTPLHLASRGGHADMVKRLLKGGAEVNSATTTNGATPLHLAASAGHLDTLTALLDAGANVNAKESEWAQTPLIFAAAQSRVDAVKLLLKRGADAAAMSKVIDVTEDTKLAAVARARQSRTLATFKAKGNEIPGPTEVQAAVGTARALYLSGEIPKGEEPVNDRPFAGFDPAIAKKGGMTALLHAARQGHQETALALLEGGASVNQVGGADGTSPLLMAVINAQFDLAMMLLQKGADPKLASTLNGVTPLWAAVNAEWQPRTRFPQPQEHGLQKATYLDIMEALLKAGADPNARLTKHPWYMVYTGCGNGNCGLEDTDGSTAFWRAAYATDVDAMKLLVKYGADSGIATRQPPPRPRFDDGIRAGVDMDKDKVRPVQPVAPGLWPATNAASVDPDPSGLPPVPTGGPAVYPIHAASGVGYGEGFAGNAHRHAPDGWLPAVKYLIELGSDVNARDNNGYTPLHHAAARGDDELIMFLVEKGADVTAIARTGQTVADMANGPVQRVSPFPKTVELLMKLGSKNSNKCVTC